MFNWFNKLFRSSESIGAPHIKFCKDCKHKGLIKGSAVCLNDPKGNSEYLVHGIEEDKRYYGCSTSRATLAVPNQCGPKGKNWEPK